MINCWLALGSNQDDPIAQLKRARMILKSRLQEIRASSLYETRAWGYENQPNFINAVIHYQTQLAPEALLNWLHEIEREHGRIRSFANAPRPLDIDILLYGEKRFSSPSLSIPHPRMLDRHFVIIPLAEISPEVKIEGKSAFEMAQPFLPHLLTERPAKLKAETIVKLNQSWD